MDKHMFGGLLIAVSLMAIIAFPDFDRELSKDLMVTGLRFVFCAIVGIPIFSLLISRFWPS